MQWWLWGLLAWFVLVPMSTLFVGRRIRGMRDGIRHPRPFVRKKRR